MSSVNIHLTTVLARQAELAWIHSARARDRCALYNPKQSLVTMPDRLMSKDEAWGLVQCITEIRWATSRARRPRRRCCRSRKALQLREALMRREDYMQACPLNVLAPLYYKGCLPHEISDRLNQPEWVVAKTIGLYILRGDLRVYTEPES